MPLKVPRILIVDDKRDDGIKIAEVLWKSGYPVRFIEYSPAYFSRKQREKMNGVRIVFMDIDLVGEGISGGGSKIFTPVQTALTECLDPKNGPYILITWSMHDEQADDLFAHLKARLPASLCPMLYQRLNKEDYRRASEGKALKKQIANFMNALQATGCLIAWEKNVQDATCDTIHEIMDIAIGIDKNDPNNALKKVFHSLAVAEAGKNLNADNAMKHLQSILSQLLYDQTINRSSLRDKEYSSLIVAGGGNSSGVWHKKLNAMLHIDRGVEGSEDYSPGDVFIYPEKVGKLPIPSLDIDDFLDDKYKFRPAISGELTPSRKEEVKKRVSFLLVEISPPCDYAQNKFVWNHFIVAMKLPNTDWKKKKDGDNDYLWCSPELEAEGEFSFRIVFNSHLIVSVPLKPKHQKTIGKKIFRIRQPLLGDMLGWLARQSSRLGHVSVLP